MNQCFCRLGIFEKNRYFQLVNEILTKYFLNRNRFSAIIEIGRKHKNKNQFNK